MGRGNFHQWITWKARKSGDECKYLGIQWSITDHGKVVSTILAERLIIV